MLGMIYAPQEGSGNFTTDSFTQLENDIARFKTEHDIPNSNRTIANKMAHHHVSYFTFCI